MKLTINGTGPGTKHFKVLFLPPYRSLSLAPAYFYEILRRGKSNFTQLSLYINSYPRIREEVDYSFIRDIMLLKPDIVAFSNFFWTYDDNLKLAKLAKSINGNIHTVFGGPQVGDLNDAENILTNHGYVDYIFCGEADFTFPDLIYLITKENSHDNIPGLAYRKDSRIIMTEPHYFVKDLSAIPVIYRADSEYLKANFNRYRPMPLETLRGCRSQCSYCQYCINTLRYRPLKSVESEIAFLCSNNAKYVRVCDSHFGGSPARAMEIFSLIRHYNKSGTAFYIYPDPDHIDEHFLRAAREANCHIISLGIETLDDDITRAISRRVSAKSSLKALNTLDEHNIKTQVDLILGLPGQTLKSFVNDVVTLIAEGNNEILFSPLMIFPGTRISRETESLKLRTLATPQNFAFNSSMSEQDYQCALKVIEMYNLYKMIPVAAQYVYRSFCSEAGLRSFIEKIFAAETIISDDNITDISSWLSMGAQFIYEEHSRITSSVVELLSALLGINLYSDRNMSELIKYDLFQQAMKARYREIGEDIFQKYPNREVIIFEELNLRDLRISEHCWLLQFDFSPDLIANPKNKTIDTAGNTYCAFVCDCNESYILTEREHKFFSEIGDIKNNDILNLPYNLTRQQIITWLKAGILELVRR